MAFGEHAIDIVNRYRAVTRRTARPKRRFETQAWRLLFPCPQAGETPRLTREIVERQLEGLKSQGEAAGVDVVIIRRLGGRGRRRR